MLYPLSYGRTEKQCQSSKVFSCFTDRSSAALAAFLEIRRQTRRAGLALLLVIEARTFEPARGRSLLPGSNLSRV